MPIFTLVILLGTRDRKVNETPSLTVLTLKTSHSKGKSNQTINIITKDEKYNKTLLYNVEVYQRNGIIRYV